MAKHAKVRAREKKILAVCIGLFLLVAFIIGFGMYASKNQDASRYAESLNSGSGENAIRTDGSSRPTQAVSPGMQESEIVKYHGHHFQTY